MEIFLHSPMHFLNLSHICSRLNGNLTPHSSYLCNNLSRTFTIYFSILCVLRVCKNQLLVVFLTTDSIYHIIYEAVFPCGFPSLLFWDRGLSRFLSSFQPFRLWFTWIRINRSLPRRWRIFIWKRLGNFFAFSSKLSSSEGAVVTLACYTGIFEITTRTHA